MLYKSHGGVYDQSVSFPTTHWSMLADASLSGDPGARAALARLCQTYRPPVIAFLIQRGYAANVVEDLAQEFFLQLLASRAWKRADREQGRFRSFLLGTLLHVVGRLKAHNDAQFRGGGAVLASLDEMAENGFEFPEVTGEGGRAFDREWALQLMDTVFGKIADSFLQDGRGEEWQVISQFLPGVGGPPTYEDAASEAGMPVSALKSAVHRVRQRFREDLRASVARTVGAAHEIDDELAYLHRVLVSPEK